MDCPLRTAMPETSALHRYSPARVFVTLLAIGFYLVTLIIAPQLWMPPFVGLPTDYIALPLLLFSVILSGRVAALIRFSIHDLLFGAFFFIMAVSALVNGLSDASIYHLVNYFKWFLLFKLIVALLSNLPKARRMMGIIVTLVTILAVEVMFHRFSADGRGWAGQTFSWVDPDVLAAGGKGRARWVGIFDGPGVFCVLFSMALPFLMVKIDRNYTLPTRVFYGLLTMLYLVAIYFIGSRGGLVATAAVIGVLVAIRSGISVKKMLVYGAILSVLASIAPSYLTTIRDQSNSTQYRVEMWAEGLDMIKYNPVLGVGRGNFVAESGKLIAHNSAVEIGGEMGLVGLILWFSMIYFSIKSLVLASRATNVQSERDFYLAMILAIVGYLVSSMFVTLEYETWYLLLAVCAGIGRYLPEPVPVGRRDFMAIGSLVLGFLVSVQIFVILYLG
jgi:O-antigen ligase